MIPTERPWLTVCQSREPETKAHWSAADMKRSVRLQSRHGAEVTVYVWEDGWAHQYSIDGFTKTFPWEAN